MALSPAQLAELQTELQTDPRSRGYGASDWGQAEADLLNALDFTIDEEAVSMEALRASVTYDAYNDLAIDEQEYLRWLTGGAGPQARVRVTADLKLQLTGREPVDDGDPTAAAPNASWWSAAERGQAVAAMLALIERPGSRAEVLFGAGATVTARDCGLAENLP